MKSKYSSHLDNLNLKVTSVLIHKICAYDDYLTSHSFSRNEFTAVVYLYEDYLDCVRRFNILQTFKARGKKVKEYVAFPFENIAFYED